MTRMLTHASMENPERLLPELNRALRSVYSAMDVLGDSGLEEDLRRLIRRFLLAEVLGAYSIVAIGGAQGAGKSTLVRGLYDLHGDAGDWLPTNEGTGEKMPVLIVEEPQIEQPCGYIRQLSAEDGKPAVVVDRAVSPQEFQDACSGAVLHALLPVLKVPRRYFKRSGAAWLLLPGYEQRDARNQVWQDLMRQGLVGASFFVMVTDSARLASGAQDLMLEDLRSSTLKDVAPVVVVSKTEREASNPVKLEQLRRSAAELFGLDEQQAHRQVICTGPSEDEDYKARWRPELARLLGEMAGGGSDHRRIQLQQLQDVVRKDLRKMMATVKSRADVYIVAGETSEAGAKAVLDEYLGAFDEGCDALREDFARAVKAMLDRRYSEAWGSLQQRLANEHEGFQNKLLNFFKGPSDDEMRLNRHVREAWDVPGPMLEQFVGSVQAVTAKKLDGPLPTPATEQVRIGQDKRLPAPDGLKTLSYVNATGTPMQWREPSQDTLHDLQCVLGDEQAKPGRKLRRSMVLLPALTLEHARAASVLLPQVALMSEPSARLPVADMQASIARVKASVSEADDFSKTMVAGLATLLAADMAGDGKVNAFGIFGAGAAASAGGGGAVAAAVANPVLGAIVAMGAIGYVTHQALQESRKFDYALRAHAQGMLLGIRDGHYVHFLSHFDQLMDAMREHVKMRLRQRFGLDDVLLRQDRLAKALADVSTARDGLLEALGDSASAVDIFAAAEA